MTKTINNLIEGTCTEFEKLKEIFEDSIQELQRGTVMISSVSDNAIKVDKQNTRTYQIMNELKDKSNHVMGIAEMIVGISE